MAVRAQRFFRAMQEHGIAPAQMARFFPELTPGKLSKAESLADPLSPTLLDHAAELFRFRREWLDGVSR